MSPDKEHILYKEFDLLYRDRSLPDAESRMCDGFACGDGWYGIIYNCSKELDACIVQEMIADPSMEYPTVFQVKEKFGQLRIYMNGKYRDKIFDILDKYTALSASVCMKCGATIEVKAIPIGGQLTTVCNNCIP